MYTKRTSGVRRTALALCVVAGAAGIMASGASAGTTPVPLPSNASLQTLINLPKGTGVQVGNLVYSDFSYSSNQGSATNPAPTASQISVSAAPGNDSGLSFSSGWESINGGFQDSVIHYAIQALSGTIGGVGLRFNGAVVVPGTGANATVNETVSKLLTNADGTAAGPGTQVGALQVINTGPSVANNSSSITLTPSQTGIFVDKDIQLNTPGGSGVVTISFVDNTFPNVPEPASLGILGVVSMGLLTRRRRA